VPPGKPRLREKYAVSDPQQNLGMPRNSGRLRREWRDARLSSRMSCRMVWVGVVWIRNVIANISWVPTARGSRRIQLSTYYGSVLLRYNSLVTLNCIAVECMAETFGVRCAMPCIELQELEARHEQFNKLSSCTIASLAAGKGEFSKWQRAGRARVAFSILRHQQSCPVCLSLAAEQRNGHAEKASPSRHTQQIQC
jgi:hypothetical protein